MSTLFYELIFNVKTKRWLELLEILEETEQVTAPILVEHTRFGRRTIMKDIKELKAYFGESIQLIGDEKGYHFSFEDPQSYYEKKQALLAEERLFLFVDQLAAGKHLENHQWSDYLKTTASSFSRIKHRLQEILMIQYKCQLTGKNNQLMGEEASIRQFLYDFYFTLPLYPAVLASHVQQMQMKEPVIKGGQWHLDPILFNQWRIITKLRVDQGFLLPDQNSYRLQQTSLAAALDQQVDILLPEREKAALFLLSINEQQFLNPLIQKEFVRMFSPMIDVSFPVIETEDLVYHLFETIILLMECFFQSPKIYEIENKNRMLNEQKTLLEVLIARFIAEKKIYSNTIYVSYQLIGSASLKRWIKLEILSAFQDAGLYLVEAPIFVQPGVIRHTIVTNQTLLATEQATIVLPQVPSKEVIQQALAMYFN